MGNETVCEHKWVHLETRYLKIHHKYGGGLYKRIDRFFCEKCLDEKENIKECPLYDGRPEWFDASTFEEVTI